MIEGFKIVDFKDIQRPLEVYHKGGAMAGKFVGFDCFDKLYSMQESGITDWVGFPQCFTQEQLIHTDKGVKPISCIQVGEKVLSYNIPEKRNEYKVVLAAPSHTTKQKILKIKMKDGTVIKVTENHLFFNGVAYVKIKDLLVSCQEKRK